MALKGERTGARVLLDNFQQRIEKLKGSNDNDVRDLAEMAEYFVKSERGRAMTVEFLFYNYLRRGTPPVQLSYTRNTEDAT